MFRWDLIEGKNDYAYQDYRFTKKMNMHIKTKDLQKVAENNFMASTDTSGVALLSRY